MGEKMSEEMRWDGVGWSCEGDCMTLSNSMHQRMED